MKIRNGFVANSSSSSFLLPMTTELHDNLKQKVEEFLKDNPLPAVNNGWEIEFSAKQIAQILYKDFDSADYCFVLSKQEIKWLVELITKHQLEIPNMPAYNRYDFSKPQDQNKYDKAYKKAAEKFAIRLAKKAQKFLLLEYHDSSILGSWLEHSGLMEFLGAHRSSNH